MPQAISNLPIGAKVKDPNTKHFNEAIIWVVAAKNHPGYPANSVTLLSERIIRITAFDAMEPTNPNESRKVNGNNRYAYSNIRQWLNKEGITWYAPQHTYDAPPSSANIRSGNAYENAAGFLSGFSLWMKSALMATTLSVVKDSEDGGGTENVLDKVFLLSATEISSAVTGEGSILALFSSNTNDSRVCMPTNAAVLNSTYTSVGLNATSGYYWGTRTKIDVVSFRAVQPGGMLAHTGVACSGTMGLRPALNMPSDSLVSDAAGADGAYTIRWNQPPTTPPGITVPGTIKSGVNAAISWTASSDPDGDAITYELQCSVNSAAYATIYTGTALSYAHTITATMNTVRYQVRARDNYEGYSGWRTGTAVPVNHPPAAPSSLTVPTPIKSGTNAAISWTTSTGASSYELQCSINGGAWANVYTGNLLTYSHAITTAMNTVRYQVRAKNAVDQYSAYRAGDTVTVNHPPPMPATLTVPATIKSGTSATITWTASTGASSYELQCSINGGAWANVYTGNLLTYAHAIAATTNTVRYQVRSKNAVDQYSGFKVGDTVAVNHPPPVPASITVPATIKSGTNAAISWASSTGASSYELQCSTNGGAYANIYTGAALSYSHAITTAMNTVRYQVRAKNAVDQYSGFRTGDTVTVIHNTAPSISGADTNLGAIKAPPTISYTITDPDAGDAVKAEITLNGGKVWQADPVTLGFAYSFTLTAAQFFGLASGQYEIKITATDKAGASAARKYTFTRAIAAVDIELPPIRTDKAARLIHVYPRFLAEPENVLVKVCNNAFEPNPVWETLGQEPEHIFSNTNGEAGHWGIGVRVTVTPSADAPRVFCDGLSIVYT